MNNATNSELSELRHQAMIRDAEIETLEQRTLEIEARLRQLGQQMAPMSQLIEICLEALAYTAHHAVFPRPESEHAMLGYSDKINELITVCMGSRVPAQHHVPGDN